MLRQYIVSILLILCVSISFVQAQSPNTARECFQRGNALYKKGDLDGAITEFTCAIELSSKIGNFNLKSDKPEVAFNFDQVKVLEHRSSNRTVRQP